MFWESRVDVIREGLAMSGRLLKYLQLMFTEQLSETVGDQAIDSLMCAQSIEEQKKIFQSMPIDKIELIMRFVTDCRLYKNCRISCVCNNTELVVQKRIWRKVALQLSRSIWRMCPQRISHGQGLNVVLQK